VLKDFARCKNKIAAEKILIDNNYTITIPYENNSKIIRYVIVIRMDEDTLLSKVFIQVNSLNGIPLYTMYPEQFSFQAEINLSRDLRSVDFEFIRFLNGLGLADFTQVEEIVLKVEDFLQSQVRKDIDANATNA
jgi:hypothetical protein